MNWCDVRRLTVLVALAACGLASSPSLAGATFGISPSSWSASVSSTQAGAHSDITSTFDVNTLPAPAGPPFFGTITDGTIRELRFALPAGLVGNPQAYPQCATDRLFREFACPADTQVGVIKYTLTGNPLLFANMTVPLFNMAPQNGRPAELAFKHIALAQIPVHILTGVRTGGDYGITATVPHVPSALALLSATVVIWGVPADPSHDTERGSVATGGCLGPYGPTGELCPAHTPIRPFLSNPTSCSSAEFSISADAWEDPGTFINPLLSVPQSLTGCEKLIFDPSLSTQSLSHDAAEPSSYTVDLHVPQTDSPTVLATPHVRNVSVTLPGGVRVNPATGGGLQGCSDAQVAVHSARDAKCPNASKLGTVKVITPLLPSPIDGAVYQGTQTPQHLLRLFIVAKGFGVTIKLPGTADLNPVTGQITATFKENPQLPFDDVIVTFKGGQRAPLVNPRSCGTNTTSATLTSWAGQTVTTTSSFQTTKDGRSSHCSPYGFSPVFHAGVQNPIGGASSTFTLYLGRSDQDQEFKGLSVRTPRGLLAHLADVPLCKSRIAAAGTCSEASRIGTVTTSAGAGSQPLFLKGKAYITGPYKGQPFGLAIVVRAKAGPLDLGNVVVRQSIQVRNDGSLRVLSDPFPTILKGIPLQVRSVQVDVDRDKFIQNPTNCGPLKVNGQATSVEGKIASVSSRFQLANCDQLPFSPKLTISVGRKGHTAARSSAPLTATLTQGPGQAGLKSAHVSLPLSLNAILTVVNNACTLDEFHAGTCEDARAGSAVAVTPLLKHALRGGVYFVKDPTKPTGSLPNLMVALRGQVDIDLTAKITIPGGSRLATTFNAVPDVPIKRFTLSLRDDSHGPIGIAEDLCSAKARRATAQVGLRAQNGVLIRRSQRLEIHGCGKPKAKR